MDASNFLGTEFNSSRGGKNIQFKLWWEEYSIQGWEGFKFVTNSSQSYIFFF